MNDIGPLRIGTRGSPLALTQTGTVVDALKKAHPLLRQKGAIEIVVITTTGDRVQNRLLAEIGGKGLFTKELDEALLSDQIDIGIHSMKDMPTILPENIALHAVMPREDVRDALVSAKYASFNDLPRGATLGTASLRRKSQVLIARPDLRVVPLRGNVDTRLKKIMDGEADATLLAYAGLKRLGKENVVRETLDTDVMLPAVGQGSLAATCRTDDHGTNAMLAGLGEPPATAAIIAERAMLVLLDGSCHTPIAGLALPDGKGNIDMQGLIAKPDGSESTRFSLSAPMTSARELGRSLAENLLVQAGTGILEAIENERPEIIRPHPEMKQEG